VRWLYESTSQRIGNTLRLYALYSDRRYSERMRSTDLRRNYRLCKPASISKSLVTNRDPPCNRETKIDKQIATQGSVIALHISNPVYDIRRVASNSQSGRGLTTQQFKRWSQHGRLNAYSPNLPTVDKTSLPSFLTTLNHYVVEN
jgi:hypothetical protein